MPILRITPTSWRRWLLFGCAVTAFTAVERGPARGQTVDVDTDSTAPAPSTSPAPVAAQPPPSAQTVTTKATDAGPPPPVAQPPAPARTATTAAIDAGTPPPAAAPATAAVQPAPPRPVAITLDHPAVIDTATLQAGKTTITLYGIEGVSGEARDGLQAFLASTDQHLRCQADSSEGFVCLMSDGTDIAQVALVNGAARTRDDAPDSYREQEAAAQAARRGIWANLPPPPVLVQHPIIQDTATLATDSQVFVLDGLQGLGQPYASQLQSYIAANGDSLTCYPKGLVGSYVCVMGDGTDLAKVALVNGAAIVAPDAPDSYRIQQADALNNRRGIWLSPPPDILVATAPLPDSQEYVLVAGDDGADGISYVGGEPMAMIDGESVVLVYGGAAGWGYYDHYHHWRGAPDRYRMHMEHFHHDGFGLRGYGHDLEARRESVMRREAMAGHPGFGGRPGFEERGGMHPPGVAGIPGHPGMPGPGGMHPPGGMAGVPGHPGMAGVPGHPGMAGPGGMHPPGAMASAAGHPGMGGPGAMHPPGMAGAPGHPGGGFGGGFARPTAMASVGGFHPGGMQATHAAAAPHPSGGGGGGHKH